MKKTVLKVVGILIAVVVGFVLYQVIIKDGGAVRVAWNGVAGTVNSIYRKATGDSAAVVFATWGDTSTTTVSGSDGDNMQDTIDGALE